MTPERWNKARELFGEALHRPTEERAAFLRQSCGADESLLREVQELLEANAASGAIIDQPAVQMLDSPETEPAAGLSGRRIGSYTIIREIGHGGMASVYLAERSIGRIRQHVAFKIMHPGLGSFADLTRRFEQEREILASLDHPNIARLIDAGNMENDAPYVVMEYVDGETIDRYCDRKTLSITDRLKLFQTVCEALEYAHDKGVVHRDLKPGNILVTGNGTVKLVDFGIAKLLSETRNATVLLTGSGLRPMTLAYASPEQIKGAAITFSTDVYSLGVVLYELLTGHRPYCIDGRLAHEAARIICEEPPVRPSAAVVGGERRLTPKIARMIWGEEPPRPHTAVLRTAEMGPAHTKTCEGTVDQLKRRLSGDLDNILLRALHKQPDHRYGSVAEFREDLGRHLAGLPILAQRPTLNYRSRKFINRHRITASFMLILPVLLGTGAIHIAIKINAVPIMMFGSVGLGFLWALITLGSQLEKKHLRRLTNVWIVLFPTMIILGGKWTFIVFCLSATLCYCGVLAAWAIRESWAGEMVLQCGRVMPWEHWAGVAFAGLWAFSSVPHAIEKRDLLGISMMLVLIAFAALFILVYNHVEIRQRGILTSGLLLGWRRIQDYRWERWETIGRHYMVLKVKLTSPAFVPTLRIMVAADRMPEMDLILKRYLSERRS